MMIVLEIDYFPYPWQFLYGETNLKDFRCLIKVLVIKSIKKKQTMMFGDVPNSNKSEKSCEIN